MAGRTLFQLIVKLPSPAELYQKHREEISQAPEGALVLQGLLLKVLREVFQKLRLRHLEKVSIGSSNVPHELEQIIKALLLRIKRGEDDPHTRLSFAVSTDAGPHPRMVTIDLSRTASRIKVEGTPHQNGVAGFIREKGRYAADRRARQRSRQIDHYTTGEFAQTTQGELLAVIDNRRIKGEPGIDVRGTVIKPQAAMPYAIELGQGVEKQESEGGKIKLISTLNGVVRSRYDGEGFLRYIAVERDLKLEDVGFRAGGHVRSRGKSHHEQALDLDVADFRTIPSAFETKTAGLVRVKELVQGKVYGAEIVAEMVNQADDKYMIATKGPITVNRSLQKGSLYAPTIIIGNNRMVATLMNAQLHARTQFTGHKLLLAGVNRLRLGNDARREQGTGKNKNHCTISGRDLFHGRAELLRELADNRRQMQKQGEQLNQLLLDHIKDKAAAGQLPKQNQVRQALATITRLEQEFTDCPLEEEEGLRRQITSTLFDLALNNALPVIRLITEKKQLQEELQRREAKLQKMTQPIKAELTLEDCKDGAGLELLCWKDKLLLKRLENEIIIERPESQERLATLPVQSHALVFSFNYETAQLVWEENS